MSKIVIAGAGPVGRTTAELLAATGHDVVVVSRSNPAGLPVGVKHVALDASNAEALAKLAQGARAIVNAVNPPYTSWTTDWPPLAAAFQRAAEVSGAALVTMSNLYAYGPVAKPMEPNTPLNAKGPKGKVRAKMWLDTKAAHDEGRIQAVEVRAGDFFGPRVTDASMGDRVVPKLLLGKKVQLIGRDDVVHGFAYMPDVAATISAVIEDDASWGRVWHAPAVHVTQRQLIEAFAGAAAMPVPKISTFPSTALKILGLVVPILRELREVEYQFTKPFVVDSSETASHFGLSATATATAAEGTVDYFTRRARGAAQL